MNRPAVKLGAFLVGLGVAFLAALAVGGAFGTLREPEATAAAGAMAGMAGEQEAGAGGQDGMAAMDGGHGAADPLRGLAVSEGGLTLRLAEASAPVGATRPLRFRVVDADGATVRHFDVEHTKRLHLIVVRRDLSGFQHLHPTQAADGSWSVPLRLAEPGAYRVFADFSHDGTPRTLAADLQVDGAVRSHPLPEPAQVANVDGLRVALDAGAGRAGEESELGFTVTRDGRPVALEGYLGAKGHLVALRAGDLAFLHVHPDEDSLRFMATFPSAGTYRLFLQFKAGGRLHTVAFTREVRS
jgi:hypothetical protein